MSAARTDPAVRGTRARSAPEDALGHLMLAFEGTTLPDWMAARLAEAPAAGVTIFRHANVRSPVQLRALTDALQAARPGGPPLLVAADQEGGQLIGLGEGTTEFAGNMALGAAGDPLLAERVARAIGAEARAVGVNVDYSPVCDVASNPVNPALGIRSFGDDPAAAGRLAAATVRGLQEAGVAATIKHFPGAGDVAVDTHHGLGMVGKERAAFDALELAPFRAAIEAGARMVMSGHFAVPGLSGSPTLPATLSRCVMTDLLRGDLGFPGVAITDALDMKALAQGSAQIVDVIAALGAGVDLLLCSPDREARERIEAGLRHAAARELFDGEALAVSAERIDSLRRWVGEFSQPDLAVVGCTVHAALARELAERSVTLVRDERGLLPLRLDADARIAAVMPAPRDLTPADTSSTVVPGLARALRVQHRRVDEFVTGHPPSDAEIGALREGLADYDVLVVGTISASLDPAQAALVDALLALGRPTVTVALRTPFDLAAYPSSGTHACTYSILPPSLDALAAALFGRLRFVGRLPAAIAGMYPTGHRAGA